MIKNVVDGLMCMARKLVSSTRHLRLLLFRGTPPRMSTVCLLDIALRIVLFSSLSQYHYQHHALCTWSLSSFIFYAERGTRKADAATMSSDGAEPEPKRTREACLNCRSIQHLALLMHGHS